MSIANCFYDRFTQLDTLSDLDEAPVYERQALELSPHGYPARAILLGNVARCLYDRFNQLGTLSDLDEALALERNALELRPEVILIEPFH
ncbi:hypothetical protein J3R83DRAFT_9071 [Lanmaoa asiatica]|nr:hypothetical protein J3R83DRAFT_9071 [Lanmaoa asiatica]